MTILKSFWVLTSYDVKGERWHWMLATLDINMANALERISVKDLKDLDIDERSDRYWTAFDKRNRFGGESWFEVFMQDDMPELSDPEHTTIYDHRPKDKFWHDLEEARPPRPGFKKLPSLFKL